MMQLRKCCSHPFLLEHPLDPKTGELSLDERIITESGKMMVLDCMMAELKKRGHKVCYVPATVVDSVLKD